MNTFLTILVLAVMIGLGCILYWQQKNHISFTRRVLTALIMGIIVGVLIQLIFKPTGAVTKEAFVWLNLVSGAFTRMLKMIVYPLIFVSIISAIANLKDIKVLTKYGFTIIAVLLITTAISAVIGIATTGIFGLNANSIEKTERIATEMEKKETQSQTTNSTSIVSQILEVIPTNPFASLSGTGSNAMLATVVFAMFVGAAALGIKKKQPKEADTFLGVVNAGQAVVMRIVSIVLSFTPYGIFVLMANFVSTSKFADLSMFVIFIVASYIALALIVVTHMIILAGFGLNPIMFIKKCVTVFSFAFTSRSSASAIPLTVKTQEKRLGVPEGIASLAASFGASIGQNGCAGMYPAMVAIMIAPAAGIPITVGFVIKLVLVITVSSFGIAGVGGGATAAALVVLTAMGLPVGLVAVLISIEPLIDMGRTLVNVSDGILAGVITAKMNKELNVDVYNSKDAAEQLVD